MSENEKKNRKPSFNKKRLMTVALIWVVIIIAALIKFGDGNSLFEAVFGSDHGPSNFTELSTVSDLPSDINAEKNDLIDGEVKVYFLDVGQGDSQLIRIPESSCGDGAYDVMIDVGEYRYADGLTDTLRGLGVEKIDVLICSHPHTDHMGCMARIIQRFEIGSFYTPLIPDDMVPTTSAYEAMLNALIKKNITSVPLKIGTEIPAPEGCEFTVFSPREDSELDDLNKRSAVIKFKYGDTSFLFTADAEKETENVIRQDAEKYGWDLQCDVLKCAHHGSYAASSAKFLKCVKPKYVVISCGLNNDYGHPHKETMEKLEALEIPIYRTDMDGTVLARTDGREITFEKDLQSVRAKGE